MKINTQLTADNIHYLRQQQSLLDANIRENLNITDEQWLTDLNLQHMLALRVEVSEFINECHDAWKYWKKKPVDRDKIIAEAVDIVHFVMIQLNKLELFNVDDTKPAEFYAGALNAVDNHAGLTDRKQLIKTLYTLSIDAPPAHADKIDVQDYALYTLALTLQVLHAYDFTSADILKAYDDKNAENFKRIANNY